MLGTHTTIPFPAPPHNHPLRHLRLITYSLPLEEDEILNSLSSFPQVTHLHIEPHAPSGVTTDEFRRKCLKQGVKVIDVPNV
ncbi:hypothetical protein FRC17_008691, partial [Serendipita sp. 399]